MNATSVALACGVRRGLIEVRQVFTNSGDLWNMLFWPVVSLIVMAFMRDATLPGTKVSLGSAAMPGVLGMQIVMGGVIGVAAALMIEREDGSLLRAKAVPNGMLAYLVGKIVNGSIGAVISVLIVLIPGLFLFDGLSVNVVTLVWVLVLGLVATMPIGAVIGSLSDNPRNLGIVMVPLMGMVAISGVFYPIKALPEWLQVIGQVFPMYWLGLGMRSALLPDAAAAAEITGSWRHLEMVGVLGVWAIIGLTLAPVLLRRMARRESGSSMGARRERAMQRVGFG